MFRKTVPLILLLALWLLLSEFSLFRLLSRATPVVEFDSVELNLPQGEKLSWHFPADGGDVVAESSWSAGNKSYYYFDIKLGEQKLMNFWATKSVCGQPRMWLLPTRGGKYPDLVTYQPLVIPARTALGKARNGYWLWSYDGSVYRPRSLSVNFVSLWLRSPLPVQD